MSKSQISNVKDVGESLLKNALPIQHENEADDDDNDNDDDTEITSMEALLEYTAEAQRLFSLKKAFGKI